MRTFKIYSHINFKIYNTVLLTIVTNCTLQTHDIYFITRNVYLLTSFTQPSPSASGNHQSVLYIHVAAAAARTLQSCPTLSNPMDCSPPGSSIHRTLQARILEWAAIAFSLHTCVQLFCLSHFYSTFVFKVVCGDFINRKHSN